MVKQFFSGFTGIVKSTGIVIICLAVCAGLCFAFVWPVWYISQNHPDGFTAVVLFLFLLLLVYAVVRKIRSGIKNSPDSQAKKTYIFKLITTTVRALVSLVLIVIAANSVLSGNKTTGLILFIGSIVLFGFSGSLAQHFAKKIKQ